MKNFKKVISSVIALAIAASSFAAVSASSFSDVADTASYAEAVDVLAALGIVTGYEEDGQFTFKPEGNITRAEAATMIVGALNMTEEAKNSSASCQFADVNEKASWAAGYVNVGVSEGFISGRSADEFDPQANVTYAEMCVMTTKLTGYADYATSNIKEGDPWYKCYTDMAASAGLNKGVSVPLTSALTRGHVAQMIYNALVTPKLGITEYSFTDNKYAPLDGSEASGEQFKTLLSEKFDGYVVTAEIMDTPKGSTKIGEVNLDVTKADWWRDSQIIASKHNPVPEPAVKLDESIKNIDNQRFQSGTAVLLVDELDEAHLVYFKADSKMETKEVAADDYVMQGDRSKGDFESGDGIQFGTGTPVKVSQRAELYVNGALVTGNKKLAEATKDEDAVYGLDNGQIDKFLANAQGNITFVKTDRKSDKFNKIFVTYYEVGEVTSVMYKGETTTVQFTVADNAPGNATTCIPKNAKIIITDDAVADNEVDIYVEKNGTEIELKEIVKGDVIAVAVNYEASSPLDNPKNIDVLVSDQTAKGMVIDYDDDYGTYTIGEDTYKYVGYQGGELDVSVTYSVLLDPFGRIVDGEGVATNEKFAILEKYSDSTDKVSLLLADGSTASYEIRSGSAINAGNIARKLYVDPDAKVKVLKPVEERVVTYSVSSDSVKMTLATKTPLVDKEYNANTGKLGSVTVTGDINIINAKDYNDTVAESGKATITDYSKFDVSEFKSGTEYTAYAYKADGTTVYSFVIVTGIGTTFTEDSRFAVVTKNAAQKMKDDETFWSVEALYKGEAITLFFDKTEAQTKALASAGDVIYFTTDGDGFVTNTWKVAEFDSTTDKFTSFAGADVFSVANKEIKDKTWKTGFANDVEDIRLVNATIVEVKSNTITFGVQKDGKIDANKVDEDAGDEGVYSFGIADGCQAYIYDGDYNALQDYKKYDKLADASAIAESNLYETSKGSDVYDMSKSSAIHNAVAMIVDGDVACIFVAYPNTTKAAADPEAPEADPEA